MDDTRASKTRSHTGWHDLASFESLEDDGKPTYVSLFGHPSWSNDNGEYIRSITLSPNTTAAMAPAPDAIQALTLLTEVSNETPAPKGTMDMLQNRAPTVTKSFASGTSASECYQRDVHTINSEVVPAGIQYEASAAGPIEPSKTNSKPRFLPYQNAHSGDANNENYMQQDFFLDSAQGSHLGPAGHIVQLQQRKTSQPHLNKASTTLPLSKSDAGNTAASSSGPKLRASIQVVGSKMVEKLQPKGTGVAPAMNYGPLLPLRIPTVGHGTKRRAYDEIGNSSQNGDISSGPDVAPTTGNGNSASQALPNQTVLQNQEVPPKPKRQKLHVRRPGEAGYMATRQVPTSRRGPQFYRWPQTRINMYDANRWPVPDLARTAPVHPIESRTGSPANTNWTTIGDYEVTALEIFTFAPLCTTQHGVLQRLAGNGWNCGDIAGTINLKWNAPKCILTDTIKHQLLASDRAYHGKPWSQVKKTDPGRQRATVTDLTPRTWLQHGAGFRGPDNHGLEDPRLVDIAASITAEMWPQGEDANVLTRVIKFAFDNDIAWAKVSDVDYLVQNYGLLNGVTRMSSDADQRSLQRARKERRRLTTKEN